MTPSPNDGSSKGRKTKGAILLGNLHTMLCFTAVAGMFFSGSLVQGATQSDNLRSGDIDSNAAKKKMVSK